ncbi:MAG TPA: M48 family metallopeptidase [Dehalococcoidales bacterium]|nr:M48 family metallopeptidase [Dehalococcoidales bacterium]
MADVINTIQIEGIGPVVFYRSRRARRIVIYVTPDGIVRVSVPVRATLGRALEFVDLKKGWILKHRSRVEQTKNSNLDMDERIKNIDKVEAAKTLVARLHHLAVKHGFEVKRVTVREQKTRWGACSPDNNISLNIKLILLPDDMMDYVILHELVHTRHHNHSKQFWAELDKYVFRSKAMSKRLKTDGLILS